MTWRIMEKPATVCPVPAAATNASKLPCLLPNLRSYTLIVCSEV